MSNMKAELIDADNALKFLEKLPDKAKYTNKYAIEVLLAHIDNPWFKQRVYNNENIKEKIYKLALTDRGAAELLLSSPHITAPNFPLNNEKIIKLLARQFKDHNLAIEVLIKLNLNDQEIAQIINEAFHDVVIASIIVHKFDDCTNLQDILNLEKMVTDLHYESLAEFLFMFADDENAISVLLESVNILSFLTHVIREADETTQRALHDELDSMIATLNEDNALDLEEKEIKYLYATLLYNKLHKILYPKETPEKIRHVSPSVEYSLEECKGNYVIIENNTEEEDMQAIINNHKNIDELKKGYTLLAAQPNIYTAMALMRRLKIKNYVMVETDNDGKIMSVRRNRFEGYERDEDGTIISIEQTRKAEPTKSIYSQEQVKEKKASMKKTVSFVEDSPLYTKKISGKREAAEGVEEESPSKKLR